MYVIVYHNLKRKETNMKAKVFNIKWDATKKEIKECQLPNECTFDVDDELVDDELEEEVSDMISDEYGFCHKGFEMEIIK